ncbi:MAG: hypothetical protein ACK5SI_07875, partial [Planctomycetia bacterium]
MAARGRFPAGWRRCGPLLAAALAAVPCPGDEPPRLAPVPTVIGCRAERIDPLTPARLSAADRDR